MKIKPQVSPTGMCVWDLPDSSLSIIWSGPGSPLMLGFNVRKPGGSLTSIQSPGSDGNYDTRKAAQAAVDVFVAKAVAQS